MTKKNEPPPPAKDARAALIRDEAARTAAAAPDAMQEPPPDAPAVEAAPPPLIPLGKRGNVYVYYSIPYSDLRELAPDKHNRLGLLSLARLEDYAAWLRPGLPPREVERAECAILHRAARALIEMTGGKIFDPAAVRACGIWIDPDTGRAIYNAGRGCWLAGENGAAAVEVNPARPPHIYTAAPALPPPLEPLTTEEGRAVLEFLSSRSWAFNSSGMLLAGWLVNSILAGLLPYHPHIWINAPRNTGKTALRDDLISLLGNFASVQDGAVSTPAAMRADLNGAALPVICDEQDALTGDARAAAKIEGKLELARLASKGGAVKMGTQGGGVRDYRILSCFLFLSVDNSLKRDTDFSRWLMLNLRRISNAELRPLLERQSAARRRLPGEVPGRLISRLMQEAPAILANIPPLHDALTNDGNEPRRAEALAGILAGLHALIKGGPMNHLDITGACRVAMDYAKQEAVNSDFLQCLDGLRACPVQFQGARWSVETLCREYRRITEKGETCPEIRRALASIGIRYTPKKYLYVQTAAAFVGTLWKGTEYETRAVSVLAAGCSNNAPNEYGVKLTQSRIPGMATPRRVMAIPAAFIEYEDEAGEE